MRTADLYIRVSTDEQADKGYSQRNQEEVLQKYCEINRIEVRKVVFEDHSAKTFIRPEWTKLLALLRKQRGKTDLVLFTKWDRFSRNAPDAYQMINTLKVLGVEPQAVEQPLDMSVPENKMMLAIYLTAPEIENDRRSLNVFFGMRRARKEGRFMATAPVGYINQILEGGIKRIIPKEPQASIIKWAFREVSENRFSIEQVWKSARERGLPCNKSTFWLALRNPVYCGKIVIPKYKDEETYWVQGLHEPLITEGLFNHVQDTLNGRKKRKEGGTKIVSPDVLPLRGFLLCSRCGKLVSGSASKGCRQYYHYYHCSSTCGFRKQASEVNNAFVDGLKDYVLNPAAAELFKSVLIDSYQNITKSERLFRKQYIDQITMLTNKTTRARELLLNGDIDSADYREIKTESETAIRKLETKISELKSDFLPSGEFNELINRAIYTLSNIDVIYCKSDNETKRKLISSMYAKNFTLEDLRLRTTELTEAFKVIYLINSNLEGKKSETTDSNLTLSRLVIPIGFEPMTYRLKQYLVLIIFVIMGVFDQDKHENLLGITNLDELYEMEALGVLRAQQYILDLDTAFIFDRRLILDVHQIVFGGLYSWAGKWRTIGTNIGIEPAKIPYALAEYADQVNYLKNKIKDRTDLIHCLSFTHHRYTQIHPFNNGNGRTARLITDLVANMNGYQNVQLYVREGNAERENYRNALKSADDYDDSLLKKMIADRLIPFG